MRASFVRFGARWGAAALVLAFLAPVRPAAAQGVTSGAVIGTVTDDAGAGVTGATLTLTNSSTGQRYTGQGRADGRFMFENVQVGGPYILEARALGFSPGRSDGFTVRLGERRAVDLKLQRAAVELAGVTITGDANPVMSASRTGAQSFVSESALARLPSLSRNFTDFIQTVPQVVSANVPGATVGGQNNRFNNVQVDGGVNNDVFGLAASGTPGGQANAHPISVEAVKEYQVLIAPFDVRQGSFAGGLINAVTKSGTNVYHGSIFGFLQNEGLVGHRLDTLTNTAFYQRQYGATVSGPIIRDRLQFLLVTDQQARAAPFSGTSIGSDTTGGKDSLNIGIRRATAERVENTLINNTAYGFNPGSFLAPSLANPDKNYFGKLTAQLATNNQLELSYNYVKASSDQFTRNPTQTGFRDGYQLSQSGYVQANITNTMRAKLATQLSGGMSNELLVSSNRIRDHRELPTRVPLIFVAGDRTGTNIAAGAERFSHDNLLNQDIFEVTDNFTVPVGAQHVLTIGTHNEFFHFVNHFFPASLGVWSFASAGALDSVRPGRYEIALPLRPGGPNTDFHVKQWGGYAQDRWSPTPRLTVTLGLRVDIPVMDKPRQNTAAALVDTLNVNTGAFPSGNTMWSPRVGFNYDLSGDGETRLRGGVGVFSGRPPYVWISNAFGNTGLEQATLVCDNGPGGFAGTNANGASTLDSVPGFRINPDSQPTSCRGGLGAAASASSVVFFDPTFKFPQNLKVALGLDHQLPAGIVGT
ncbi:MAG TPA: TonB-dependent receptor, partial [Gemmatimonadales bacterium]|nr:TonB-dependent receptor [Gemmatimonadales bacterium]